MKAMLPAFGILATILAGLAIAAPPAGHPHDETYPIDLTAAKQGFYWLRCPGADSLQSLSQCRQPMSLWLEENGLSGLQTAPYYMKIGNEIIRIPADHPSTP